MSEKKLLLCPICGGEAQFVKLRETYGIPLGYVQCTECGLRLRQENCTEDFARNKWNTRVPMQKIVERLEEEASDICCDNVNCNGRCDCCEVSRVGSELATIVKEEGGLFDGNDL